MVALLCLLDFVNDFHLNGNKGIKKVGRMVDRCKFIDVTIDETRNQGLFVERTTRLIN